MNRSRPPAVGELINVNAPCDLTIIIGGAFYRAVPDAVPVGVRGPGCSPSPASVGDLTAPRPDESNLSVCGISTSSEKPDFMAADYPAKLDKWLRRVITRPSNTPRCLPICEVTYLFGMVAH